jgi:predicted DNA-binding transcriptional regulator YafY
VLVDPGGWNRPPVAIGTETDEWLAVLRAAVLDGRRLRIRYAGQRNEGTRLVDPWGLVAKAGIWYLVAAHRGRPRMYRVSRIAHVTVLEEPANRPPNLDLAAVWAELRADVERPRDTPVEVTLRVRNDIAPMLRRIIEPQLVPAETSDDPGEPGWRRLVLTFRALAAARGSLLGFGDDVEVLAPEALRTGLRETAAAVVRLYA